MDASSSRCGVLEELARMEREESKSQITRRLKPTSIDLVSSDFGSSNLGFGFSSFCEVSGRSLGVRDAFPDVSDLSSSRFLNFPEMLLADVDFSGGFESASGAGGPSSTLSLSREWAVARRRVRWAGFRNFRAGSEVVGQDSTVTEEATLFSRGSASNLPFQPGGMAPRERGQEGRLGEEAIRSAADDREWLRRMGLGRTIDFGDGPEKRALPKMRPDVTNAREAGVAGGDRVVETAAEVQEAKKPSGISYEGLFADAGDEDEAMIAPKSVARARARTSGDDDESDLDDEDLGLQEAVARKQQQFASASSGETVPKAQNLEVEHGAETSSSQHPAADIDELLKDSRWKEDKLPLPIGMAVPQEKEATDWAFTDNDMAPVKEFAARVPHPAKAYPFELDDFQKRAICHLEKKESVFVAAHTSAGKTVVAEYAIALCARHMSRAVYTSPIKALSNQKFRDFKETFAGVCDVGLITGDVSIAPEATCLILTTEILRSMLYRGADLVRDIEWVIFDEVHYVNDAERGVVWEEVIIMLPEHVNLIMLSATVPNALAFADWIGRTKRKKIFVTSTLMRPVPLEHFVYTGGGGKGNSSVLHKIVDSKREFLRSGYTSALEAVKKKAEKSLVKGKRPNLQSVSHWSKLVSFLSKQSLLPAVVFVFSKRLCESIAFGLSGTDLAPSASEKNEIRSFVDSCVSRLEVGDRSLPQIVRVRELLKRGIGVHHGGLLPIVKEMVEILFGRGLVRVLVATETFAMGVNMPARAVVFSQIRKNDGKAFRDILPGEYTQMSGRAGRRGKDAVGTVIINVIDTLPEASVLHTMTVGSLTNLQSQFRLTYNMMLNLLRIEDLKVEDMMKRSFGESAVQKDVPQKKALLEAAQAKLSTLDPIECVICGGGEAVAKYYEVASQIETIEKKLRVHVVESAPAAKHLQPCRVVALHHPVSFPVKTYAAILECTRTPEMVTLDVAVIDPKTRQCSVRHGVRPSCVTALCRSKVAQLNVSSAILGGALGRAALNTAGAHLSGLLDNPKLAGEMDPQRELKMNDLDSVDLIEKRVQLVSALPAISCHTGSRLSEHLTEERKRHKLAKKVERLSFQLSDQNLQLMPEFEQRLEVLKRLNYIDPDHSVLLKGRVAREINTCDEMVATELIFENALTDLSPPELVSIMSALVCEEKSATAKVDPSQLPSNLKSLWKTAIAAAQMVAKVQTECGMKTVEEDEYVQDALCPSLMEVSYEWARQLPFADLCAMTMVQEGSIVRYIVRIDESLKELRGAARVIGDPVLFHKAEEASLLIHRNIVFSSSLYVA